MRFVNPRTVASNSQALLNIQKNQQEQQRFERRERQKALTQKYGMQLLQAKNQAKTPEEFQSLIAPILQGVKADGGTIEDVEMINQTMQSFEQRILAKKREGQTDQLWNESRADRKIVEANQEQTALDKVALNKNVPEGFGGSYDAYQKALLNARAAEKHAFDMQPTFKDTRTQDIKNYEYYVAQQKLNNKPFQSFEEWTTKPDKAATVAQQKFDRENALRTVAGLALKNNWQFDP